jgi:hypothetical protein
MSECALTCNVDGANRPFCLNELIDRLGPVDRVNSVNSSISAGCITIDHDGSARVEFVE